ncbi:helix-turn-helix domain-containing protein [Bradyrhizobium uaiense]|uniref:Helix-turn-helix transcriptional regulator n=1 Tax=Bradyrhizobium uaiense TaxID=2594946 RepID=A0A6P1BK34_9BRAD|nr:helix-turn-helix transcriptional regulator [Bradyrhizobium uaiense]
MTALFKTLKRARLQLGLSQESLGRKLKIPQNHISAMESGKVDVRASTLTSWARAVGLELLIVPRVVVPAVEHLKKRMTNSTGEIEEGPAPALYEVTEVDD